MKKLLLSLAAILGFAGMNAATVSLNSADATDFQGTHYDKELKDDGTTKTNERWQPLEGLKIGDYTFSFTTPSDAQNQTAFYFGSKPSIRLYNGGTMTVQAPAGAPMAQITFICDGLTKSPNATVDAGTITYTDKKLVWQGDATEKITITVAGTVKITSMDISDEAGETPVTPPDDPVTPPATTGNILDVENATDIQGTHYDKELNDDGTTKQNEHYQPLKSLKIGDYTFTFSYTDGEKITAPALYLAAKHTIRLYNQSEMTIQAPAGTDLKNLSFKCDGLSKDPAATANTGSVAFANGGLTWTASDAAVVVDKITFSFGGSIKILSFEVNGEGNGDTPIVPPAEGTLLEVGKATNVQGTHCDKELNDDGSTKMNERYQPLESLKIDDYSFTFSYTEGEKVTAPALYLAAKHTIRLYNQSEMTITAPAGVNLQTLKFNCDGLSKDPVATANTGSVKYADGALTWTADMTDVIINKITFSFGGTIKILSFEVNGKTDTPVVPPTDDKAVYAGLVNDAEGWTFENGTLSDDLEYVWKWTEANGKKYLNGSAYKDGAHAAEALAISPVVDLAKLIDAEVTFDHAARFQTNLRTDCKFLIREVGAPDWTELDIPTWPEAGGWTFVNCGNIDLSEYLGLKVQFAFKYVSTASGADTWEINNFIVKGEYPNAVNEIDMENVPAEYYDLNGRRIFGDLSTGIYIKRQGAKVSKVLVK